MTVSSNNVSSDNLVCGVHADIRSLTLVPSPPVIKLKLSCSLLLCLSCYCNWRVWALLEVDKLEEYLQVQYSGTVCSAYKNVINFRDEFELLTNNSFIIRTTPVLPATKLGRP